MDSVAIIIQASRHPHERTGFIYIQLYMVYSVTSTEWDFSRDVLMTP